MFKYFSSVTLTKSIVIIVSFSFCILISFNAYSGNKTFTIDQSTPYYITADYWAEIPSGGDTVFISSSRTEALKILDLNGEEGNPIVFINKGGQVKINDTRWGAITFQNCKHIKISGTGDPQYKYGFLLAASTCGLAFSELSSDCEAEFIKISHEGFMGIMAKKDYGGYPPVPIPVFENLSIHDCFIENVTEGMYLGETKSPGMEFKHVRVYNNIVRNTGREAIQIANMVEDVELYNNTLLNAGTDDTNYHGNLLQIGDNTVVKAYNNIISGAPAYGIMSLGSGDNYYQNNYISDCKGVFVDDRDFTKVDSVIVFSANYFSRINHPENEVIRNLNGENYLVVTNNVYDDENALFYRNYFSANTNYTIENNRVEFVSEMDFENPDHNNYALTSANAEEFMNMGAPGGPEYFYTDTTDTNVPVPQQIVLTAEMLVDEVEGGSYKAANYLIDEQGITPESGGHPVSESWKPFWNMDKAPYHIYFDLGKEYNITQIAFHDMHNSKNLDVSVGEPGNWTYWFTESCDKYKTWKVHDMNITTRYIRLSMNESVYAAVNELILFGYANEEETEKSSVIAEGSNLNTAVDDELRLTDDLFIYQNPVQDNLEINIPTQLAQDFTIEVFDIRGAKLVSENFVQSSGTRFNMNIADQSLKNGVYIMRFSNAAGEQKALKFLKSKY